MPDGLTNLSDFKPLRRLRLPDLGDLKCSGLILLVGPNSSGKSQLLQDIYRRIAGEPRELVVASEIQIEKPPLVPFLKCLESEGYFTTTEDASGNKQLRPQTMYLGTGQAVNPIQPQQAEQWYSGFTPEADGFERKPSAFLNYFGRLLVTALFLDRRLTALSATNVIDFLTQPPQHDLHALYLDDGARELLHSEMLNSFGRSVWPDMSRGNQIALKVSDQGVLPTPTDRLSYKNMAAFRTIETEGDGMKSYVATCVALLLGARPVCLIDEPEMCLHPPQAYNLGKFIGRFGAKGDTVTLVATHSSHLLRGVIQATTDLQIVRQTRRRTTFHAHLVPRAELTQALARPTLRAESVLDGIFAEAVVVVEADGDRLVYQAAWETLMADFRMDVHFATVGGTGGIADTCGLYKTLRIPIAVIADLDMLMDRDRMKRVLLRLIHDHDKRKGLITTCADLDVAIRAQPPTMTAEDVSQRIEGIGALPLDWSHSHDNELVRQLRRLANAIDRTRRLKSGGALRYGGALRGKIEALVQELTGFGLFLVPVGELEEWLSTYNVGVSKNDKRAWSNEAARIIRERGKQTDDVWGFMTGIGKYLQSAAEDGLTRPDPPATTG